MNQPDIVKANEPGTYYIKAPETKVVHTWAVGDRYEPVKVLGEGSFSCVIQALDRQTGQKVALKRVGDVLASIDNAKRVIRECAILRRLHHPNIVALMDLFTKPSSTGRWVYRGGKLVATSIDLYMVLEYCSQGDLFHLKGQLSATDVQYIMWQLLEVLKYIHTCQVWHRDVKSANVLVSLEHGRRVAKLCDFGSARSASRLTGDFGMCDNLLDDVTAQQNRITTSPMTRPNSGVGLLEGPTAGTVTGNENENYGVQHQQQVQQRCKMTPQNSMAMDVAMRCQSLELQATEQGRIDVDRHPASSNPGRDSADQDTGQVRRLDLYARPSMGPRGGFDQPLTRAVCTPCYRAPEVVMSHGQYSSALDMWSLGCVFGELQQRVTYPGSATTPHLQVAPVIAVTGFPATPKTGDHFHGPGNETTCKELAALFNVVGTPPWGTIDAVVQHPAWHAYLKRLPGRSSQLYKRFAMSGEQSVDLLSRLLEFDPRRRATAEEAQSHEYFDNLKELFETWAAEEEEDRLHECSVQAEGNARQHPADRPIPASSPDLSRGASQDSSRRTIDMEYSYEQMAPAPEGRTSTQTSDAVQRVVATSFTAAQAMSIPAMNAHDVAQRALTGTCAGSTPSGSLTLGALTASEPSSPMSTDRESSELGYMHLFHVQQAEQAAKILAALEDELEEVCEAKDPTALSNGLRQLLERECTEHQEALVAAAARHVSSRLARGSIPHSGSSAEISEMEGQVTPSRMATPGFDAMSYSDGGGAGTYHHKGAVSKAGRSRRFGNRRRHAAGLLPDPGVRVDPSDLGKERLPHHRDAEQAAVTPEQHLRAGRHQEWVPTSLAAAAAGGRQDKEGSKQQRQAASSGCWGVSLVPPGMEEQEMSPGLMEAIRQQHAR